MPNFLDLIEKPEQLHLAQTAELERYVEKYPWFESLYKWRAKKAQLELHSSYSDKVASAAIYSKDRSLLYDYIQSKLSPSQIDVKEIQSIVVSKPSAVVSAVSTLESNDLKASMIQSEDKLEEISLQDEKIASESKPDEPAPLGNDVVGSSEIIRNESSHPIEAITDNSDKVDLEAVPMEAAIASQQPAVSESIEALSTDKLEPKSDQIGGIDKKGKYSFLDWLKQTHSRGYGATVANELVSDPEPNETTAETEMEDWREELIPSTAYQVEDIPDTRELPGLETTNPSLNSFISNQIQKKSSRADIPTDSGEMPEDFIITETLAKLYLKQRKYEKAIYAYKRLALKFPEKSSLFAHQIFKIQELNK